MKEQLQHIQDHAGKGKKIVPGDIVWAKVDRLPWYPAEVYPRKVDFCAYFVWLLIRS